MTRGALRAWLVVVLTVAAGGAAVAQTPPAAPDFEPRSESTLFRETIAQDIATSTFHELVSWLEALGLSTRGDRPALVSRLAGHYGVSPDDIDRVRPTMRPGETPPLVVDAASRTRYFTLEEVDERYVRLSGGVILTLRDDERGTVHRIRADEITFNEVQRTLAASGSVRYTLERDGTVEEFTGEALTVELDHWESAFVRGVTQSEQVVDGQAIDFRFTGSYITRSRDDVIVLEDGIITSSEADPPNYHIRASKIWILAPGEWGLRNAVLYVGRVPLLYLPFYFRPGHELFFNPSIGVRDRSGPYIQTTTYLAGTPEEREHAFSLLQLAEDRRPQSEREIRGLFLVPRETPPTDPPEPDTTVRLMADLYTRLGAFAGLDAAWPRLGPLRQVRLYLGLAASRHIYLSDHPGAGSAYTPYLAMDGVARQSWNTSRIAGVTFPFRYGVDVAARTTANRLTTNLQFQAYSDRRFRTDFGQRAEQIDWLGLLGQGTPAMVPAPIDTLRWQIDGQYTADVTGFDRVSTLALQRAVVALNWRSRAVDPELLSEEVRRADNSPEAAFFYPASLRLPELSGVVAGTLFDYPPRTSVTPATGVVPPPPGITPPWGVQEDGLPETHEPAERPLVLPPILAALPAPRLPDPFSMSLRYRLVPVLIVDRTYLHDPWEQESDVDFSVAYGGASASMTGSLDHGTSVLADLVRLEGTLATTLQYRDVFSRHPDFPDAPWATLQRQAWSFTSSELRHNLTASFLPLRRAPLLAASSLSYTANLILHRIRLDEVVDGEPRWAPESIEWDERFFSAHQIAANVRLGLANTQSLVLTAALPPRSERYTGRLSLVIPPLTSTITSGVTRPGDDWAFEPLAVNATVRPFAALSLANVLRYDLNNEWISSNQTTLTAGPMTGEYEIRRSVGYTFEGPGVGWRSDGDERLRPARARVALSLSPDLDPFWRNRVRAEVSTTLDWTSSLLRYTEGSLRHTLSGALVVHRFLTLRLQTESVNTQPYVYIPRLAEGVGRDPRNPLFDLLRSFNFFDRQARVESGFNLQSVRLSALHDLGDWDFTVGYAGRPEIETAPDGIRSYRWRGTLDLRLQWRPIRELSSAVSIDRDAVTFGGDS